MAIPALGPMYNCHVYRIQNSAGRGPFQPGFSKQWADEQFEDGVIEAPTWMQEFGSDLIERKGTPGYYYGSAVREPNDLRRWFSKKERERLWLLGFKPMRILADAILAESIHQVVFESKLPLNTLAFQVKVPWE